MCGRFLLEPRTPQAVRQYFDLDGGAEAELEPRWNLAPTQDAAIVRSSEGGRELARARWGLIPSWSKDATAAARLINARSETAAEKPSFRAAWKTRRCVVPATGWYEWRVEGGRKQPWLLRLSGEEFTAFAGLWERWSPPGGPDVESFTILTAPAVPTLAPLHHRMPAVLPRDAIAGWLEPDGSPRLPSPERWEGLPWEFHPVATRVNSPRHDDAACAAPMPE